eukprot:12899697-Prorocentrum_lima.AAC.1
MTSSLVGSEMCIRDSIPPAKCCKLQHFAASACARIVDPEIRAMLRARKASHGAVRSEQHVTLFPSRIPLRLP